MYLLFLNQIYLAGDLIHVYKKRHDSFVKINKTDGLSQVLEKPQNSMLKKEM